MTSEGGRSGDGRDRRNLVSLMYRSRATDRFKSGELGTLISGARERNRRRGVTGALYYDKDRFLQWIEGPPGVVEQLFETIGQDTRHTDVEVVSFSRADQRLFDGWNLRLYTDHSRWLPDPFADSPNPFSSYPMHLRTIAAELARGDCATLIAELEKAGSDVRSQVSLCEQLMPVYAAMWRDDLCNDIEISLGLALALSTFRRLVRVDAPTSAAGDEATLVVPVPGEPHILGAALASTLLAYEGIPVNYQCPENRHQLASLIEGHAYRGVALISSGVFSREDHIDEIRAAATTVRQFAPDSTGIALCGCLGDSRSDAAELIGAEGSCGSAAGLARFFKPKLPTFH